MNVIGFSFNHGIGVRRDLDEALKWYRMSAERGHRRALNNLGILYADGAGVPQDSVEAHRLWILAAAQGHEGETLLAVVLAGLLHDYDPARGAQRPEVSHTLEHLAEDEALLRFFDRLELGEEGRWLVRQLILGTEFPLRDETTADIRLQIATQRPNARWQLPRMRRYTAPM